MAMDRILAAKLPVNIKRHGVERNKKILGNNQIDYHSSKFKVQIVLD